MKKHRIIGMFAGALLLTLSCSVTASAATGGPAIKLNETDTQNQFEVQMENLDKTAYSLQFEITVKEAVTGDMSWADETPSSYHTMTAKKEKGATTFTFYLDRLSPISNSETVDLGTLTLKGGKGELDFTTSGKMKTLNEKVQASTFDKVALEVNKKAHEPDESESQKPDESETPKPDESETPKPDESETSKPDESETSKPDESESQKPDESETSKPDESETQKPDESEKPKPDDGEKQTEVPTIKVPGKLTLNKEAITLYLKGTGKTATLSATIDGKKVSGVTWKAGRSKCITVKNGKITAKKAGKTIVTATKDGVKAVCSVTVKTAAIRLDQKKATLYTGSRTPLVLKATVNGKKVSGSKVKWSTDDSSIATVKNGKVTAKKSGTVKITAEANGKKAACTIKVKKTKLILKKSSGKVQQGEEIKIPVKAAPQSAVRYRSGNTKIAAVSKKGIVKGISRGVTKITVTCNGIKRVFTIKVR